MRGPPKLMWTETKGGRLHIGYLSTSFGEPVLLTYCGGTGLVEETSASMVVLSAGICTRCTVYLVRSLARDAEPVEVTD